MAIKRASNGDSGAERYSVNLNIVLTGSKKITVEEAEKVISTDKIHVVITSEDGRTLVDAVCEAKEFSTGSVGFGFNQSALEFQL